jgi:hypothetical protein
MILVFSYLATHYMLLHRPGSAPKTDVSKIAVSSALPKVAAPHSKRELAVEDSIPVAISHIEDDGGNAPAYGGTRDEERTQEDVRGPAETALALVSEEELANVALNCKVFASSTEAKNGLSGAQQVVDGDLTSRWSSQWEDPQWLVIDINQNCEISTVEVLWETAFAKTFRVDISLEGSSFLSVGPSQSGQAGWTSTTLPEGTRADLVRVYCISRSTEWGNSVFEVRVQGKRCRPLTGKQPARQQLLEESSGKTQMKQKQLLNQARALRGRAARKPGKAKASWEDIFRSKPGPDMSLHATTSSKPGSNFRFVPGAELPWAAIVPNDRAIHFVFGLWSDGKAMPLRFQSNLGNWKAMNKDRPVHVWNNTGCSALVAARFPQYEDIYHNSAPIQKADLIRYMIVFTYGGFYGDLDVECADHNNLSALFIKLQLSSEHSALTFWEMGRLSKYTQSESASLHPVRRQIPEYRTRIANYAFWCKPGCGVLQRVLGLAMHRVHRTRSVAANSEDIDYLILYTTGPDAFTEASIGIRDADYSPLEGTAVVEGPVTEPVEKRWLSPDQVLVVDPGPLLWNGNTFSWRGSAAALGIPVK